MRARIHLTSIFVTDQAAALTFYTEKLGFVVHDDIPLGEARWLTVTAADDTDGTQLLLEPNDHPAARAYTAALAEDGIPAASFQVDDVAAAHTELVAQGVQFVQDPVEAGPVTTAVLDDTCGNLIQLVSPVAAG